MLAAAHAAAAAPCEHRLGLPLTCRPFHWSGPSLKPHKRSTVTPSALASSSTSSTCHGVGVDGGIWPGRGPAAAPGARACLVPQGRVRRPHHQLVRICAQEVERLTGRPVRGADDKAGPGPLDKLGDQGTLGRVGHRGGPGLCGSGPRAASPHHLPNGKDRDPVVKSSEVTIDVDCRRKDGEHHRASTPLPEPPPPFASRGREARHEKSPFLACSPLSDGPLLFLPLLGGSEKGSMPGSV